MSIITEFVIVTGIIFLLPITSGILKYIKSIYQTLLTIELMTLYGISDHDTTKISETMKRVQYTGRAMMEEVHKNATKS